MQKYIIERNVPGIGAFTPAQVGDIIHKTRAGLMTMAGRIQWQESYITDNKVFSIYIAPDEATIREFSKLSPLPTDAIHVVKSVVDLTTAE